MARKELNGEHIEVQRGPIVMNVPRSNQMMPHTEKQVRRVVENMELRDGQMLKMHRPKE